jgi:hypothetical protein
MPTSYTAAIADDISFNDFVMGCARAMGALISMRDSPSDAVIPEWFVPSAYHKVEASNCFEQINVLCKMPIDELEKTAFESYSAELAARADAIRGKDLLRHKYSAMLEQVNAWETPTPDHLEFKSFMVDQINTSLIFDCDDSYYKEQVPLRLSGEEWLKKELLLLQKSHKYHLEEQSKEVDRTERRNLWLRQLRESLAAREAVSQGD